MEKITNLSHSKNAFLFASSRMLERASYYGLRTTIVLYMISEILKMDEQKATSIYALFTTSIIFSQIIGAIFGDLLMSNKRAAIIGGVIQTFGAFCCGISSTMGLYIGLFLIVIGGGFYSSNIISLFGKQYLNKIKLLDSGFNLFFIAINIGSFLGVLLIGYFGEYFGWNIGFCIAGILMFFSLILVLIVKEEELNKIPPIDLSINLRAVYIVIAVVFVGLFWMIYEFFHFATLDIQNYISDTSTMSIPNSMLQVLNSVFLIPVGIIALVFYTYFYSTQFFKLMLGFIFGALSFGILFLLPTTPIENHLTLYLISILFLNISETHISPIVCSVLTQYVNPKYLAIFISLSFLPTRLFSMFSGLLNNKFLESQENMVMTGLIAMTLLSIVLFVFIRLNNIQPPIPKQFLDTEI